MKIAQPCRPHPEGSCFLVLHHKQGPAGGYEKCHRAKFRLRFLSAVRRKNVVCVFC